MEKEIIDNKTDSIKVSKGMNEKYSFEIKRYYDNDKTSKEEIIKDLKDTINKLKQEFE